MWEFIQGYKEGVPGNLKGFFVCFVFNIADIVWSRKGVPNDICEVYIANWIITVFRMFSCNQDTLPSFFSACIIQTLFFSFLCSCLAKTDRLQSFHIQYQNPLLDLFPICSCSLRIWLILLKIERNTVSATASWIMLWVYTTVIQLALWKAEINNHENPERFLWVNWCFNIA